MAKAATASAPKKKKKSSAKPVTLKVKVDGRKKKEGKKAPSNAVDALWKLADHPLVGELVALGATAAVAAIAQQGLSKSKKGGSNKAVKEAGKAAAAAIGARLISEFAEVKKSAKTAKS